MEHALVVAPVGSTPVDRQADLVPSCDRPAAGLALAVWQEVAAGCPWSGSALVRQRRRHAGSSRSAGRRSVSRQAALGRWPVRRSRACRPLPLRYGGRSRRRSVRGSPGPRPRDGFGAPRCASCARRERRMNRPVTAARVVQVLDGTSACRSGRRAGRLLHGPGAIFRQVKSAPPLRAALGLLEGRRFRPGRHRSRTRLAGAPAAPLGCQRERW